MSGENEASSSYGVRKGQGSVKLTRAEFGRRFRERYYDPAFEGAEAALAELEAAAWTNYHEYHKSPRTRPAGPGFAPGVRGANRMAGDARPHRGSTTSSGGPERGARCGPRWSPLAQGFGAAPSRPCFHSKTLLLWWLACSGFRLTRRTDFFSPASWFLNP